MPPPAVTLTFGLLTRKRNISPGPSVLCDLILMKIAPLVNSYKDYCIHLVSRVVACTPVTLTFDPLTQNLFTHLWTQIGLRMWPKLGKIPFIGFEIGPGASTPPGTPGTHPRQYLVSRGRNILYPPKFVIVVFIMVNSVLTVHIIWRNGWRKNASKFTDLHVTIQIFSGGYAPNPDVGDGLRRPSPNPIFLGTPALRASRASLGASNVPSNVC